MRRLSQNTHPWLVDNGLFHVSYRASIPPTSAGRISNVRPGTPPPESPPLLPKPGCEGAIPALACQPRQSRRTFLARTPATALVRVASSPATKANQMQTVESGSTGIVEKSAPIAGLRRLVADKRVSPVFMEEASTVPATRPVEHAMQRPHGHEIDTANVKPELPRTKHTPHPIAESASSTSEVPVSVGPSGPQFSGEQAVAALPAPMVNLFAVKGFAGVVSFTNKAASSLQKIPSKLVRIPSGQHPTSIAESHPLFQERIAPTDEKLGLTDKQQVPMATQSPNIPFKVIEGSQLPPDTSSSSQHPLLTPDIVSHATVRGPAMQHLAEPTRFNTAGNPISTSVEMVRTLVATPNILEIGVAGGQHGWIRVRAELGHAGQVATSLLTSSSGLADGLHKELPAISAYLKEQNLTAGSLVVNAPSQSGPQGHAQPASGALTHDSSGDRGDGGQAERRARQAVPALPLLLLPESGPVRVEQPLLSFGGTGSWLSIRV
jgi:hypothetical protein